MLLSKLAETPFLNRNNITDFINNYNIIYYNYKIINNTQHKRIFKYYIIIIAA